MRLDMFDQFEHCMMAEPQSDLIDRWIYPLSCTQDCAKLIGENVSQTWRNLTLFSIFLRTTASQKFAVQQFEKVKIEPVAFRLWIRGASWCIPAMPDLRRRTMPLVVTSRLEANTLLKQSIFWIGGLFKKKAGMIELQSKLNTLRGPVWQERGYFAGGSKADMNRSTKISHNARRWSKNKQHIPNTNPPTYPLFLASNH